MDAVVDAHNGDVVMIDGTSVRVPHAGATLKKMIPDDAWVVHAAARPPKSTCWSMNGPSAEDQANAGTGS